MQKLNTFEAHNEMRYVRSLMHDEPFGDPFSGTPYGQYHKSKGLGMVLGVVASVVTMGAALPMLASTTLATQIAGGVMMSGGVLSGVGAVTGNKKLSKIGGILSLAGGVGGALTSTGAAQSMGGAFAEGSGNSAMQGMAKSMMESINSTGINVYSPSMMGADKASAATAGESSAAQTNPITQAEVSEVPLSDATAAPGATSTNSISGTDAPLGGRPILANASKPASAAGGTLDINTPSSYGGNSIPPNVVGSQSAPLGGASVNPASNSSNGFLDKALAWTKENPELTKIAGEGLKTGLAAAFTPDQQAEIDAKAAVYEGQANILKTQNDILAYQAANAQKQVAMISLGDPDLDAKVKEAGAKGVPVAFIPNIGAGGVTTNPGQALSQRTNMTAAQVPARNPNPQIGQTAGA